MIMHHMAWRPKGPKEASQWTWTRSTDAGAKICVNMRKRAIWVYEVPGEEGPKQRNYAFGSDVKKACAAAEKGCGGGDWS